MTLQKNIEGLIGKPELTVGDAYSGPRHIRDQFRHEQRQALSDTLAKVEADLLEMVGPDDVQTPDLEDEDNEESTYCATCGCYQYDHPFECDCTKANKKRAELRTAIRSYCKPEEGGDG